MKNSTLLRATATRLLACAAILISAHGQTASAADETTAPAPATTLANASASATTSMAREDYMKHYTVQGTFEDVREALQLAITGRGIVINNISHIGKMLTRTGGDLGKDTTIYLAAEAFEFCSATVSRNMMQPDPHNIVFCPYIIAVYTLPSDPKTVHLSFRRPLPVGDQASQESLRAVEKLLDSIVAEAMAF